MARDKFPLRIAYMLNDKNNLKFDWSLNVPFSEDLMKVIKSYHRPDILDQAN